jgi:hypothetical protein
MDDIARRISLHCVALRYSAMLGASSCAWLRSAEPGATHLGSDPDRAGTKKRHQVVTYFRGGPDRIIRNISPSKCS